MADEGFQSTSFASASLDLNNYGRDFEYGSDLASGIVFTADFHKFDDLKNLLDTNKDPLKLDAMRRIVEIKKLVYSYLTRYAEDQQDLALLSISTFQRGLKDPNQLIRASALRVLSSIRIPMIVPIVMLAIQEASKDLSPYVRKTAAHAIMKVYSLDPDQKDDLVDIIDRLLGDKTTLVVGSAVRAFEELCPDRLDLIHKHYRKLCALLMDVDEWGQVTMISMLTRYARTQFMDPSRKQEEPDLVNLSDSNSNGTEKPNVAHISCATSGDQRSDAGDSRLNGTATSDPQDPWQHKPNGNSPDKPDLTSETLLDKVSNTEINPPYSMSDALPLLEADQNALLNACRFLLRSHNSAVVVAASQLLYYLNSKDDLPSVVKALIRTMHSSREIQYVILSNIATLTVEHRNLFEPYLRSFFVYATDAIQVKLLKLEILSNLTTESTSSIILREFQHYVNSPDPEFVTATIQAIGRCASSVPQIADICLNGLVRLMSRPNERIMAECVVVLRKLLQMQTADHKEIISHIAQMANTMKVPSALASILWLLGEYSHRVPRIAPDVLRKMAKTFPQQETVVKFQIINLAAKLCIVNPRQTHTLAQYVLTLAKYDQNYDIRDKSRFLRALLYPQPLDDIAPNENSKPSTTGTDHDNRKAQIGYLAKHARKICLATKPAPIIHSKFKDRCTFRLGSLSHILNRPVPGYEELPDWPTIPPNPWSRVVVSSNAAKDLSESGSPSICSTRDAGAGELLGTEPCKPTMPTTLQDFFSESEESEEESIHEQDQGEIELLEPDIDSDLEVVEDSSSESDFDVDVRHLAQMRAEAMIAHQSFQKSTNPTHQQSSVTASPSLGTFEPSDSDEATFSSSILNTNLKKQRNQKQQQQQQRNHQTLESWLGENDSETEVVTDVEKDEVLDVEESLGVEELDTCSEHIAPNIIVKGDTDNNMTTESRTSSTSVPLSGINSGLLSGDLSHTNSVTPVSSMLIESSLLPATLHTMPTPMPSFDHLPFPSINHSPEMGSSNGKPVSFSVEFRRKPLPWTHLDNPHPSKLELKWQFARTIWNHNPKLVILTLSLSNQHESIEFHNIHLDLMGTAIGRLLLDANRVEPFKSISRLASLSTEEVFLGIDFAGFTDPVELDLVYFEQTNSSSRIKWRLSIAPSALELIRPVPLSEERYFHERRHFSGDMITHLHLKMSDPSKTFSSTSNLVEFILEHANLSFLFAKLLPSTYPSPCQTIGHGHCPNPFDWTSHNQLLVTTYFAGRTISDNHLCLVQFTHNPNSDELSSKVPGRVPDQNVTSTDEFIICLDIYCASSTFRSCLETGFLSLFKC